MSKGEIPDKTEEIIRKNYPAIGIVAVTNKLTNETRLVTGINIDPNGVIVTFGGILGTRDQDLLVQVYLNCTTYNVQDFRRYYKQNLASIQLRNADGLPKVSLSNSELDRKGEEIILVGCESTNDGGSFIYWSSDGRAVPNPKVDYLEFGLFENAAYYYGFGLKDSLDSQHLAPLNLRGA